MKTALLVATGLLVISATASADTYLGMALGTQPDANDGLTSSVATPSGRSLRGLLGVRFGNISIEGALNGFGVVADRVDQTVYQLSAALKLSVPLGNNFEVFGRGGIERTWLNLGSDRTDLTGDGFVVGGGFEFRLNALISNASIFVDYNVHHATLEDAQSDQVDETTQIWGVGFTVGI